MKPVWRFLAVAAVLAVAVFLRTYRLNDSPPGLHADEAMDGNDALQAWRTGHYRVFYPENSGREGLFINLQAVALGLSGGPSQWALRLPGAFVGCLTVLGLYLLVRAQISVTAAMLAGLFMATSLWHIITSRLGTRIVAAPCFLVWTWYLLDLGCAMSQRNDRRWRWAALGGGVVLGLGFHTYTAFRVTPLLFAGVAVHLARRLGKTAVIRVMAVATVVALLLATPLALYGARHPAEFWQRVDKLSVLHSATPLADMVNITSKTVAMYFVAGDLNERHNIPGRPMLEWPVAVLFLGGLCLAWRRHAHLYWVLTVAALPAVLATGGIPNSMHAILTAPIVFMLAGLAGDWLAKRIETRAHRLALPSWLAFGTTLVVLVYHNYFRRWDRDPRVATAFDQSLLGVARRLESLPRALPKYVILESEEVTVAGLPLGAQVLMFLTDTATPDRQEAKNLHYLWPQQTNQIALGYVYVTHIETLHP